MLRISPSSLLDSIIICRLSAENQTRVVYLDFLRILATVAVVFLHVTNLDGLWELRRDVLYNSIGNTEWFFSVVGHSAVTWCVPLFVMISGALFLEPTKDIPIKKLYKKNILRLVISYVFWWSFYSLYVAGIEYLNSGNFKLGLQPFFHLWFLPMLICIYVFIPILRNIAEKDETIRYALLVWFAYLSISFIVSLLSEKLHLVIPQLFDLFRRDSIIGYSGFFLLGYYLNTIELKRKTILLLYNLGVLSFLFIFLGTVILSYKLCSYDNLFMEFLTPLVSFLSISVFVFVKSAKGLSTKHWVNYVLDLVRKDLFGVYLTHPIWLLVINRAFLRCLFTPILTLPLITIMVFILSLFTSKIFRQVPFLRRVIE